MGDRQNGALLYRPASRETRLLAEPVSYGLPDLLRERGVTNLQVGRSIVATWLPNECTVLGALRDLGLDRQPSRFRLIVKDEKLADQVRGLENNGQTAESTKRATIEAIQQQYTLSA